MVKIMNGALWTITLLSILCIGIGCVARPSPAYTPRVLTSLTSQPTAAPGSTGIATPDQTPTSVSLSTPHPLLNPLVLRDITVFYSGLCDAIWRIKADGSERQMLFVAEEPKGEWYWLLDAPRLSHDSQRLAFIQSVQQRGFMDWSSSLWIMYTDGSEPSEVVSKGDLRPGSPGWSKEDLLAFLNKERPVSPIWSPDDSLIAFVDRVPYEPGRVCILDVESGQWWKIGEGEILDWSPDGSMLAVHSANRYAATSALQILNLDGTVYSAIELSPFNFDFLFNLDWSETTGLIAIQGGSEERPGTYPVFVIDPYSDSKKLVLEDSYHGYSPQWSPDGKQISFERVVEDVENLYVLDLDSGEVRLVMPNVTGGGIWSPDSRLMLVRSEVDGDGLYIVSVSDGSYWKIPNVEGSTSLAWLFPSE